MGRYQLVDAVSTTKVTKTTHQAHAKLNFL